MIHKNRDISVKITERLKRLLKDEPPLTPQRMVMRTNIMGYELGDIQHFTTVNTQDPLALEIKQGLATIAQLGMADLITQCRMLCLDMDWDFDRIQLLGLDHLEKRHRNYVKVGYAGAKSE